VAKSPESITDFGFSILRRSALMTRSNPVNPYQYHTPTDFVTTDGGSPAASSPVSAASGANRTLTIPDYAAVLVVIPDQDARFSESSVFNTYSMAKQNLVSRIPVGDMEFIYFRAADPDVNLYFHFERYV